MIADFETAQIPLLAVMLIGGCVMKLGRALQDRSVAAGIGPTALFPMRLRRPAAIGLCAVELGFGVGLIVTAGTFGAGAPAVLLRTGTGLLFVVATSTLLELRSVRPDIGCGCFGDLSSAPVTGRTLLRSALLAMFALISIGAPPIGPPPTLAAAAPKLVLLAAELALLALLSPEVREVMVRIGYSTPCERRVLTAEQALTALYRSRPWRKHASLVTDRLPSDMWRELCWRYMSFRGSVDGREADLVFAVYLQHFRPTVLSVMVDAATGAVIPRPAG